MITDTKEVDTIIIGGGLSGLYAAALLAEKKQSLVLLEARARLGGRILSPSYKGFYTDLGPSWYWPMVNPRITALIQKLGLVGYPQYETGLGRFQGKDGGVETIAGYPMNPSGWRLEGGMMSLINSLCNQIPDHVIRLNHPVCEVRRKDSGVEVIVGALDHAPLCRFAASRLILALPPRLAASSVLFTPDLPFDLAQAMLRASTWMAGHAKFFALYDHADWRELHLSGQGFSLCGPLGEVHDGSNKTDTPYGLTGFLSLPALRCKNEGGILQAMMVQLGLLYGGAAGNPVKVFYRDWAKEAFTATEYDQRSAHNHPEFHPPGGKKSFWDGCVHFAGTETADEFGGYLEGALASGARAAKAVACRNC